MTDSRHIHHPGNDRAVDFLLAELRRICGAAWLDPFQYGEEEDAKTYYNVWAEIPGSTNELLVIGAHLDSTAANDVPYDAAVDAAPGADDDASGVAAVLEVARVLCTLARGTKPKRSIRFVLFNAEEQLMVGSKAHASALKQREGTPGAPSVVAMLAMDMIGWHKDGRLPPLAFEIHGTGTEAGEYGRDDRNAREGSDRLAATVVEAAKLAPQLSPQTYPLPGEKDPTTNRSDHSMFHYQGWPACLVAEDQFIVVCNTGSCRSEAAGNPSYHKKTDLPGQLKFGYLADIARTVAAAAWMLAKP
jgi:Zn-dependent M28 family amino/carboxypeptidase